jgi:hypothetical protein
VTFAVDRTSACGRAEGRYGGYMPSQYSVKDVKRLAAEEDFAGLTEVLKNSDQPKVLMKASDAFMSLAATHEVDFLLSRLTALDVKPRIAAEEYDETREEYVWGLIADALGYAAEPGSPAADILLAVLEWPDGTPVRSAMLALAQMDERRAIEPLLRRLDRMDYRDPSTIGGDLEFTSAALASFKAEEAVEPLIAALVVEEDRESVVEALGDIGDPRAVAPLAALLDPEPPLWVGNAIWNALNRIGTPEAKAAIAAWEERGETPPDAHEWRVEKVPSATYTPFRRWWYKPHLWFGWLSWRRKLNR